MAKARRRRTKWVLTAVVVVAVCLGAGIGISEAVTSGPSGYHTAVATTGVARETLDVSGTTQPAHEANASFQVAGTVTSVAVSVGQQVDAGQTLATLDTTSLQEQVSVAETSLLSAQAALTENEANQQASSSGSPNAQTTAATSGHVTAVLTAATTSGGSAALAQAQQAVVDAQHAADLDIQTAQADTQASDTACAAASGSSATSSTTSTTTSTTTTTTPSSTTTTTTPSASSGTPDASSTASACTTALQQALAAENQVAADQANLDSAESALAQLLTATSQSGSSTSSGGAVSGSSPPGSSSSGSAGKSSASQSSNGTNPSSSAGQGGSSTSATSVAFDSSQQLASDQSSIDSDEAALVEAQQNLAAATLTSPLSGTVASVGIAVNQSVSAGSTSDVITIISPGEYETTASLTSSQVGAVRDGDQVQATIDGTTGIFSGTVSRVGPVQESDSTYAYPVVIALDPDGADIAAGSATQLSIDLAEADDTLVVPTSAVHTASAGDSYVDVIQKGNEVEKKVTVGVVGTTYTQITSGITDGTRVVLADLSAAVPSSSTNSTFSGGFPGGGRFPTGGGGFPTGGGGGGGGGFPAGGFQISSAE